MSQTLILAKSITEANHYAKVAGLDRFTYRAVRSAGSIRGVRNAEVHILSSFTQRIDRYAILGALRWAKTLTVFYVDFRDGEILDGTEGDPRFIAGPDGTADVKNLLISDPLNDYSFPVRYALGVDQADPHGPLTDELYAMAYVEHEARGHDMPEPSEEEKARVAEILDRLTVHAGDNPQEPDAPSAPAEPREDPAPAAEPERRTRRRRCSTGEHLVEAADLEAHEAAEHTADVSATRPAPLHDIFG